jgi:hypothetical protein
MHVPLGPGALDAQGLSIGHEPASLGHVSPTFNSGGSLIGTQPASPVVHCMLRPQVSVEGSGQPAPGGRSARHVPHPPTGAVHEELSHCVTKLHGSPPLREPDFTHDALMPAAISSQLWVRNCCAHATISSNVRVVPGANR